MVREGDNVGPQHGRVYSTVELGLHRRHAFGLVCGTAKIAKRCHALHASPGVRNGRGPTGVLTAHCLYQKTAMTRRN